MTNRERRNLGLGLAFLAPNILGFLTFALIPLGFSLVMAFTNWDLKLHNMFKDEPIRLVSIDNFTRLVTHNDFWRFLGNTLFDMMGIPFSVAGSLMLALLLTRDLRGGSRRVFACLFTGAVMIASVAMLAALGMARSAMTIVLCGLACGVLVFGVTGGTTFYRTMFYLPHFCAGVATYILWKKLYSPFDGPINRMLDRPLATLAASVNAAPPTVTQSGLWLCLAAMALTLSLGLRRLGRMRRDGELGWSAAAAPRLFLILPILLAQLWAPNRFAALALALAAVIVLALHLRRLLPGEDFPCAPAAGMGTALMFSIGLMVAELVLLGFGIVFYNLPAMAADGLAPPKWINDYDWAKPSLMIMGLWGAIGSNNMLLYIAGLSNVPVELYEAADIDGASPAQRFWNVTWPQLAPTTFFIAVMATIAGLRGGFETARTMTMGGPAGSTTFLSYFIFTEGFDTGRLGYSSAVAWMLFAMTFALTIFNWKFGNKYVND